MRIVQICRNKYKVPPDDNGSIEWLNYWLSEELVKRGHEVITYAPKGSTCKGKVIYYPSSSVKEKDLLDFVIRTLPDHVDIIHDHTEKGDVASGNLPIPTIKHSHSVSRVGEGIPLYVSQTLLKKKGGDIGYFLHNGIKLEEYQFRKNKEDYLLFFSRIHRQKGAHEAIKVAKLTGRRLVIAGPIQEQDYFDEEIKPHLGKDITFVGPVAGKQKQDLLKKAYCLVFTTNFEDPFPLVPLEALACGTPVIANKRGGLPEQLRGMKQLLHKNTNKIAKYIEKGKFPSPKKCRKYIKKHYTISIMTDNLLKIYKDIIKNNSGGYVVGRKD